MYGKIFEQIYDGTLRADWKALITFQQLIILCDEDGVVDMTAHALHGRTGIPFDIIEHGLKILSEPDPHSRSPAEEGRRIILIDKNRPWGWRLVNHSYYRSLLSRQDKKEKDRVRIAEKRSKESTTSHRVAGSRVESSEVVNVAHTNTNTNTNTKNKTTCTEPTSLASVPEVQIVFPTNKKGEQFHILKSKVKEWEETYPGVDVPQTLKEIRQWLLDNRAKRKTSSGMYRFINSWLIREQNGRG